LAAWRDAEALIRATARVERSDGAGGWNWRGTAYFVADRTLFTCAHVVAPGEDLRVVWPAGEQRRELSVSIASRFPDLDPAPDGPYPLPDLAVLHVDEKMGEHPIVWLDTSAPEGDLWAYGYTDEYREGMAYGHSAKFPYGGIDQVDDEGGTVLRLLADRVKPGMSGAPVLDLRTGRVVAMIKRTQDAYQAIGAFATGMAEIRDAVPELVDANHAANATPERDQKMAVELWGTRVVDAAEPFRGSRAAREEVAAELALAAEDLHGDPDLDAERIARELFASDLHTLVVSVSRMTRIVGAPMARKVFDAVAPCTSHDGEPWVATIAAAEIGAQVALLARQASTGRVLHLRSRLPDLSQVYVRRGDRKRVWGPPLDARLYSHVDDDQTGLPVDLERELRIGLIRRFSHMRSLYPLTAQELDEAAAARWELERPKLLARLRERGVVGLLSCERLDPTFIDALVARYPLVFLVAMGADVAPEVRDNAAYEALEPGIDDERAEEALYRYSLTYGDLGGDE
jgi:hypothetical protein